MVTSAVFGAGMVALGTASAMPSDSAADATAVHSDPVLDPTSTGAQGIEDENRGTVVDRGSRSGRSATLPEGKTQAPQDVWVLPVKNYDLSSLYGARWGTTHYGVDLAGSYGTPVYAAHEGVVTRAGWFGGYGYAVEIDHGNGVTTRYGHNSEVLVSVGERIQAGHQIAKMGSTGYSTGNHSHFEVRINDDAINPVPFMLNRGVDIPRHKDSIYAKH
ncbi:MAG: M23 family metallopeptidase [Micromonosporaceae bacterium]